MSTAPSTDLSTGTARARIPRVLSIAGTDPTGGAGLQADLKSIAAHGGYGLAVATALVAQNTRGVRSIHRPPVAFLREQLDAVGDDVVLDAVKLGMLFDDEVVATVAAWLDAIRPPVVVLDPVMVATSGDRLLTPDAEAALRDLLSRADLVTPNLPELAVLVDRPVATTWAAALEQARALAARYDVRVLAKGGHLDGDDVPDALVDPDGTALELHARRVPTTSTHGTGCSLSSAVATLQARYGDWERSVREAKVWLTESLEAADDLDVGQGHGPVSHLAGLWRRAGTHAPAADDVAQAWWSHVADLRDEIDALPFVRGLADGTLPVETFRWYLAQDALYLRDYARVLAHASALAPTASEQAFWASSAHGAIATELDLHASWLPAGTVLDARPSATTTAYTDHLLATAARGGYAELVAAVLPCFWVYLDVGRRLSVHATAGHPYTSWLRTYADEAFARVTHEAVGLVTTLASGVDAPTRARMLEAFVTSTRHERDFFAAPGAVVADAAQACEASRALS